MSNFMEPLAVGADRQADIQDETDNLFFFCHFPYTPKAEYTKYKYWINVLYI